jgi:hypothetical protein
MLRKEVIRGLWALAIVSGLTACFSMHNKTGDDPKHRNPSSVPGSVYDGFSQKGYEEATHRQMQEGKTLAPEQVASEMAGREIWYKSAPNGRFHTYIFGQRVNAPINWYQVLRTDNRFRRFDIWGTMNDPDCCTPGKDCDAKGLKFQGRSVTVQDTYGFDYCPGDEELLSYVGHPDKDYLQVDPACHNPAVQAADMVSQPSAGVLSDAQGDSPRENACHLAFGTSTGAIGFRKFPNPRFNKARWEKINRVETARVNKTWDGVSWDGYTLRDIEGSVEPPFRVGITCASCHATFEPTRPPADVNHPEWHNISGTVGNQYIKISDILGSGTHTDSLEQQLFLPTARPGVTDTSAVVNDYLNNPGTINAIINLPQRPVFTENMSRWFHVPSCNPATDKQCQEISYASGQKKYWHWDTKDKQVFHILKGGEDSVGPDVAVQRVYVNIGMCAEQCWMNHHTDLHALSPNDRGFGQTPFQIAQCRRDCAPWRANEDRVGDIVNFLLSARPSDLKVALKNTSKISGDSPEEVDARFSDFLEDRYGVGSVDRGRQLFAKNCATCHSSQNTAKEDLTPTTDDFSNVDFHKEVTLPSGEILRADWMGNDKSTSQAFIGTYQCRSRHTNHLKGHVWEQFASNTYRTKPATQFDMAGRPIAGGLGYYRNISLLNAWAYAPFLHNNAVGPEVCGKAQGSMGLHHNSYEGQQNNPQTANKCDSNYDPSIEGRLAVFDASVEQLLTPDAQRPKKMARATQVVHFPLGLTLKSIGHAPQKFYLEFGIGTPLGNIGNFDWKGFLADMFAAVPLMDDKAAYDKYWTDRFGDNGREVGEAVRGTVGLMSQVKDLTSAGEMAEKTQQVIRDDNPARLRTFFKYYSACPATYENMGHNILVNLNKADRDALKAFLATL